jgi:Xaa-Pro aminopeptidase
MTTTLENDRPSTDVFIKTPNQGTGAPEDRDRVAFTKLRHDRRQRVLAEMERREIDVCFFGREANVRYVCGARRLWTGGTRPFGPGCVVVRETGTVHLMTFSASYEGMPAEVGPEDFYSLTWNPMNFVELIKAMDGVAAAKRVGVDGLSPLFQQLMPGMVGTAEIVAAEEMMRGLRRVKLPDEIAALRIAASVAESSLVHAISELRPGVTESSLRGAYLERACNLGSPQFALQGTFTVVDGPQLRHMTSDRAIDDGELVAMHAGSLWAGYEGSLARTWLCGSAGTRGSARRRTASAAQRALHDRWRTVMDAVVAECRPGRTGADLRRAHESTGEPLPSMTIASSLGIGHEGPIAGTTLGPDFDAQQRLEPNMVLEVRTFVAGSGGGVYGADMVLVTEDGPEPITTLGWGPLGVRD